VGRRRTPALLRPERAARAAVLGLLVASTALACAADPAGSSPARTPEASLRAFSRALGDGRVEDAYALMSTEYRARVGLAEWKQKLEEDPHEVLELANSLGRARGPADETAEVTWGDGQSVLLARSADRWLITTDLLDFYDQSTPRAALRSFLRAMRARRYDAVLRFIPGADREGFTPDRLERNASDPERADIERLLSSLQLHLDAPIEVAGERATMPYAEQSRVSFVREGARWKLEALE
jgi:hypothetical protein